MFASRPQRWTPLLALLILSALLLPAGALAAQPHKHVKQVKHSKQVKRTKRAKHFVAYAADCAFSRTSKEVAACKRAAHVVLSKHTVASVTIVSAPAASTTSSSARFTWKTTGTVGSTRCSLDGAAAKACASGVSYSGLAQKRHTFKVQVSTATGSASTTSDWTVVAPAVTTTPVTTPPTTTTTPPTTTPPTTTTMANTFGANAIGIAAGGDIQNDDPATLTQDLNLDQSAGARWIRVDINWAQIQAAGPNSYNWSAIDSVVEGAEARGMQVLGTIVYTPSWAAPAGAAATYGPSPSQYAAFAHTAVAHYAAMGVNAYEIWNEENTVASWTPAPSTAAYAALLQAAYPAIKSADPAATVVTGGLAPSASDGTNISPVDFLSGIYANGAKGSFDAVGMHPYCNPDLPGQADSWSPWYQMYGTSTSLRSVMVANGDSNLKIWGTEFGAPSSGTGGVSEAFQAQTVTDAYQLWSTYSWAGPLFFYQGRDLGTDSTDEYDNYGFATTTFSLKPAFYAYQQAAASL